MIIDPTFVLVILGVILAIVGNISYLISVLKKESKPHPFTWLVGSIVSSIIFFAAWRAGGGIGVIPIFVSEFFTILIFLFSLKYGFKNINKSDKYFLVICLIGIVPWLITSDPTWSVIIVVIVDLVSFIPTIRKTLLHPESESVYLYISNFLRHLLILSTLAIINISTSLHSFAMIIINFLMILIVLKILRKKHFLFSL